ncbi:helix-turn-helix domain-containing protein [Specibacter cremeus]|uniref:helix-turn-helix domain-containing protein n=1 Tax=Specibacter cremeus TaxID=1629051 RepID=UPI000F7A52CA|nr:helix-turn-helix domain-containing protein [Specibacter cremeus]
MIVRGEVRNAEALGRMLAQGRMLEGLTQRQLAEQLGITQKYVWEVEQGKPGIFTDRLFQILRTTGVKLYAELEADRARQPAENESEESANG